MRTFRSQVSFLIVLVVLLVCTGVKPTYGFQQQTTVLKPDLVTSNLQEPRAIGVTDFGQMYVVERGKNRLLILNQQGQRIDSLGNLGSGDYQFNRPEDIDVTNGLRIYVADQGNRRIQVYTRRTQYITSIQPRSSQNQSYEPLLLTTNGLQEVFFYNDFNQKIVKINRQGEWEAEFGFNGAPFESTPMDIVANGEWLYLLSSEGDRIDVFSTGGSYVKFWKLKHKSTALKLYEQHLWTIHASGLVQRDATGRINKEVPLTLQNPPIDFALVRQIILVLSGDKLLKYTH